MKAVEIDDLSYRYPDGTLALSGVSLSVEEGETLGLVGPNGAGKSTLLLHLNGILGDGAGVTILGTPLSNGRDAQVRGEVGLVFQNPDDQLFMPRVFDDVAFGALNQGYSPNVVRTKVEAALAAVGMSGFESRAPHHLSIGQKKRVAIATVLVMDSKILALDEPTSGLDPRGRRDFMTLVMRLPCTRIIASHDLEMTLEVCDRVALLDEGRLITEGEPAIVLSNAYLVESHGLEVPASLKARSRQ
jgi:cobalt/nickel transport system ATP-binding protein